MLHSTCGAERLPDADQRRETGSDRSGAGAIDPPSRAAPSIAILGTDALLAAQPATAVQLTHACLRVGYQAVVPASWGDELVAGGCLRRITSRHNGGENGPAIFCACPYVAHRLLAVGSDLEPFLASFVAPPVAVARYLRALYTPTRIRLTYVGRCPGAADDSIDARLTPEELLAVLGDRGVDLSEQPRAFDSVIPPDRRRFRSQPGGLPDPDALRRADPDRRVIELTGPELVTELAQHLLSKNRVVLDVATRLGCVCSGAVADVPPESARPRVTMLEPPRASSPIIDDRVPVLIELPLPSVARDPIDIVPLVASRRSSGASRVVEAAPPTPESPTPPPTDAASGSPERRRSPTHGVTVRQHSGTMPTTRSGEGRTLPRAYVARRGSGGGARGRGPSTPPRGEAAQRLDAAARGGGGAGNGGGPRGSDRAERAVRSEPPMMPASPAIPSAIPPVVDAPGREIPVRAREAAAVSTAVGAAPGRATDTRGQPPVAEMGAPQVEVESAAEPRGPSPISGVSASRPGSFRVRTVTLARAAASAARQRRTMLAALLGVALLSASVGILAGRWLAVRAETPSGVTR